MVDQGGYEGGMYTGPVLIWLMAGNLRVVGVIGVRMGEFVVGF